ncbi:hypothetical protein A4G30_07240 [Mycobacterium kansasii]|uniref:Uncharacterized protein n=1 Tax=Mycobacterium kansasii ATCC 12478 TaxID=557599 RepID=U5X1C6_MYCKA|nr:hypothetical protein MKAN_08335 [Mycobacterium kansasii ATCC 12478]KZS79836.1 hypothetical protein A4G30_07240 [Mycobacterium kansasii]
MPPGQQVFQLWITGEIVDSKRHAFDDCGDWVVESPNVFYNLVDESVDGSHCAGDEQRVGIGKVAVHRLTSDSQPAGDVGKA